MIKIILLSENYKRLKLYLYYSWMHVDMLVQLSFKKLLGLLDKYSKKGSKKLNLEM